MPVIASTLRRLCTRLRHEERGVTMYLVLGLMVISSLLMAGVLTATSTDATLSRRDLDAKKAVYAAQAGIAAYLQALNANPNYWTTCPSSPGYSTNQTVPLPGSTTGDESYSYTPLPAPGSGYSACSQSNPVSSMVTSQGTFRVQFNGFSGVNDGNAQPVARSYVVTFKHESFLNYIWFTAYEQLNPSLDSVKDGQNPSECVGQTVSQISIAQQGTGDAPCQLISWVGLGTPATTDDVAGPMFSDDFLYICGNPIFGRNPSDLVYTQGLVDNNTDPGVCGTDNAQVNTPPAAVGGEGTLQTNYQPLTIPQSNDTLAQLAKDNGAYYQGVTYITLTSTGYQLTNPYSGTVDASEPYPNNGVIYVDQAPGSFGACTWPYSYDTDYTVYDPGGTAYGCGTVFVQGTYTQSLTIASANDVVVDGSLISGSSNALLGLVPQDWARVYHQVGRTSGFGSSATFTSEDCSVSGASNNTGTATEPQAINSTGTSVSGSLDNPQIDAAILTTQDSWIVDNYTCGASLGDLNVDGAIAQYYRGTVGTTANTGYIKAYVYDTRLASESPPYFLSPVNPAWSVQSEAQCSAISDLTHGAPLTSSNITSYDKDVCY